MKVAPKSCSLPFLDCMYFRNSKNQSIFLFFHIFFFAFVALFDLPRDFIVLFFTESIIFYDCSSTLTIGQTVKVTMASIERKGPQNNQIDHLHSSSRQSIRSVPSHKIDQIYQSIQIDRFHSLSRQSNRSVPSLKID